MPPLPPGTDALWGAFLQLHRSRGSAGMGPASIGWQDLAAWQQVAGVQLTPWEIDTLLALDSVALSHLMHDPTPNKKP